MNSLKGWIGEQKTKLYLWLWLSNKRYVRYHDIVLASNNGTTQIDHLVISTFGVFIIETKNKKGWIFGSEKGAKWTQTIYGKKYSFQNPLRQTYRQKKVLSALLEIDESKIQTVIYFVGDCKFKTSMPANVLKYGISRYIKEFSLPVFSNEEVDILLATVQAHLSSHQISRKEHIQSLNERHTSNTICPKCGSDLAVRIVKKGSKSGTSFLGCSSFPKCRFSKGLK